MPASGGRIRNVEGEINGDSQKLDSETDSRLK